jgi:hypothetical protein
MFNHVRICEFHFMSLMSLMGALFFDPANGKLEINRSQFRLIIRSPVSLSGTRTQQTNCQPTLSNCTITKFSDVSFI